MNLRRNDCCRGFTLVEMMITMTIGVMAIGMALSTFMFGLKTMYKDTQRLASNANLRSFTAQITKETLDASYFYLFDYYTRLDGSVNLTTDYAALVIDDNTGTDYDKWASHGDCLVLVTNVVVSGVPIMGEFHQAKDKVAPQLGPDSPVVRVKGLALMGSVSVQRQPPPGTRKGILGSY